MVHEINGIWDFSSFPPVFRIQYHAQCLLCKFGKGQARRFACIKDLCTVIFRTAAVGILVDTVQKMIDVDTALILPSPSQDTRNLVSGMCSLSEEQTMLVFDCPQILNQP